jgi:hypothetical protein
MDIEELQNYKAPKIISLEIDEFDEDSGVDGIALVEQPAIESDWVYFSSQKHLFESYSDYPDSVSNNAKKGIELNEKQGNKCATQVGKVRGQQLAKKEKISVETIKRMYSYLSRAQVYYDEGDTTSCGYISYMLWGGLSGKRWAESKLKELGLFEGEIDVADIGDYIPTGSDIIPQDVFVENAGGFSVGDYVSWTFAGRGDDADRGRGQIKELRVSGKLKVPGTDFELSPTEDRPAALIETVDGKLVGQYTENLRKIKKPDNFDEGENIDVLGYRTKYFYMCKGAIGTFLHLIQMEPDEETAGMIRSAAQIADNIFKIEHDVIHEGVAELEELGEAQTLLDDFKDLMKEIDELLGMKHDISYMDGHIEVIRGYIDDIVLEYILREIMGENKYIQDLPQDTQDKILERLDEIGESEEELEKAGWVLVEDEQKFAISSKPNEPSIEDYGKFRIRYKYTGPKDSKNRTFCRKVLDKGLVFRKEDINNMSISGENSQFGVYDIFTYKGSYGCRHYWTRLVYEKGDDNRERKTEQRSVDESSSVNAKPTMNRNPNSETLIDKNATQTAFSKIKFENEKQLIAGPLMIPRRLIYRFDENNGEYWVYFTEETIEKIAYKYLMNKNQDQTNLEHSEDIKLEDVVLVESWLVQDPEKDKSYALTGEKYEKGTWFGIMKVKNSSVWEEWVKTGRVKGFSVEGFFADKMINASKHQFYYRTTKGGTEIVIDHETLVVFILKDGERTAILPDGTYELTNGTTLRVIDSKAVEGSF